MRCGQVRVVVSLGLLLVPVHAGLQAGTKKCGELSCENNHYCDPNSSTCEPCSSVCLPSSHNFQENLCDQQCQDYLHQKAYITRDEVGTREDINSKVARLTALVTVTLILVVLVLLLLLATIGGFLWHQRRKRQNEDYTKSLPPEIGSSNKMNGALKIEMPPAPSTAPPPVTPATTSTPLSSRPRYPKEDPTLEYGAYDNPALTPSPVFDNKQDSSPTPNTTTPITRRQESSF